MVFLKKKAAKNFSKSFENICEGAQNSNVRNRIPATCFILDTSGSVGIFGSFKGLRFEENFSDTSASMKIDLF